MQLNLFSVILLCLITSNVISGELTIPEDKAVIEFETKLGMITFAHKKHAELSITQCSTCHHKLQATDTVVKACHECHQHESTDPDKTKVAFHTRCTGCHEEIVASGQSAGPLQKKCKLCHIRQALGSAH